MNEFVKLGRRPRVGVTFISLWFKNSDLGAQQTSALAKHPKPCSLLLGRPPVFMPPRACLVAGSHREALPIPRSSATVCLAGEAHTQPAPGTRARWGGWALALGP